MAEVLLIRQLLRHLDGRPPPRYKAPPSIPVRALLILPYISIVSEKAKHLAEVLQPLLQPLGCKVRGYHGVEQCSPMSSKVGRSVRAHSLITPPTGHTF